MFEKTDFSVPGTVKSWNDSKGYGFIRCHDGLEAFAHYSVIVGEGIKTLVEGQRVMVKIQRGSMGIQCWSVEKVGDL